MIFLNMFSFYMNDIYVFQCVPIPLVLLDGASLLRPPVPRRSGSAYTQVLNLVRWHLRGSSLVIAQATNLYVDLNVFE